MIKYLLVAMTTLIVWREINHQDVVSNHLRTINEYKSRNVSQDKVIAHLKTSNVNNIETLTLLSNDLDICNTSSKNLAVNYSVEIENYKTLIDSMAKDINISKTIELVDCTIEIEGVTDDKDYISKSITTIGF